MNRTPNFGKPAVPFWSTREFRWLLGILVLVVAVFGVIVFEILPLQRSLQTRGNSGSSSEKDFLPRARESRLPKDPQLESILARTKDSTPVQSTDESYRALLSYLKTIPPALLGDEATQIRHALLSKNPGAFRGKPFVVTAMVLDWKPVALVPPEAGIDLVYRAFLLDPGGNEAYVVDLLEKPEKLEQRDVVSTEALFLKLATYETRKDIVEAPMLLAHSLRPVVRTYAKSIFDLKGMTATICILSVALLLMTIWFQRQASARRKRAQMRPQFPESTPSRPWEGFVEREWKAAAAGGRQARPHVQPRPPQEAVPLRMTVASPQQTKLWLFLAATACLLLGGWTVYRVWRDSQPPGSKALDFDAESDAAWSKATEAREAISAVEARTNPQASIAAADVPVVEDALWRLQQSSERLQDLFFKVRESGKPGQGPSPEVPRESTLKFLRIQLWVLDATHLLDHVRSPDAPRGFFLPLRAIAESRRETEDRLGRLEAELPAPGRESAVGPELPPPREAPSVSPITPEKDLEEAFRALAAVDAILKACSELEEYLKSGLEQAALDPATLPELADLRAEQAALGRQKDRAAKLVADRG